MASAQTLRWDANPALAGAQSGDGDWNGGNFWIGSGGVNQAWVDGSDAVLTGGLAAGLQADGVSVDDISAESSYTLGASSPGGVLTLGGMDGESILSTELALRIYLSLVGTNAVRVNGVQNDSLVEFAGTNLYQGDTFVDKGRLEVRNGLAIPDGSTVVLAAGSNATVQFVDSETIGGLSGNGGSVLVSLGRKLMVGANNLSTTFSGTLNASGGSLEKIGTGSLELAGQTNINTLTVNGLGGLKLSGVASVASVSVQAGTLVSANSGSNLGSVTVGAGAILEFEQNASFSTLSGAGEVKLGATVVFPITGSIAGFTGILSGAGAVTASGVYSPVGLHSYSGGLTIFGNGILAISDLGEPGTAGPLGTGSVTLGSGSAGSTLRFTGGTASSGRPLSFGGTASSSIEVNSANGVLTLNGLVSGTGGLVKTGPGSLTLTNGANSFSGNVSVSGGTLSVSEIGNIGSNSPLGAGNSITLSNGGRLKFTGVGSHSANRTFNLAAGQNALLEVGEGAMVTLAGAVNGGSSSTTFRKEGLGTLHLAESNNYNGTTMVNAGSLIVSGGAALPNTRPVVVAGGARLELQSNERVGSLEGSGTVELGSNALAVGFQSTGNLSSTFSGVIVGSGVLAVENSDGALTLSGVNTFSGGLRVNGTVRAADFGTAGVAGPLGTGTVNLGFAGSSFLGRLIFTGAESASARAITIGPVGGVIASTNAALNLTGLISGDGGLTIGASGHAGGIQLSNPGNSFTGIITVDSNTLTLDEIADSGVASLIGAGDTIRINQGARLRFTGTTDDSSNRMVIYGGAGNIEVVDPGVSLRLDSASGNGGLAKTGLGTLIQTNASNSFSGNVSILEGILQTGPLQNSAVASALGTGNALSFGFPGSPTVGQLSLLPGSNATTNRFIEVRGGGGRIQGDQNTTNLTGAIVGSGQLTLAGTSASHDTFILSGVNTYTGVLKIDQATVRITSQGALPNGARIEFAAGGGGVLQMNAPETISQISGHGGIGFGRIVLNAPVSVGAETNSVFGGSIEGTGTLTKIGDGILALLGSNTLTGNVIVSAGTLFVSDWTDNSAPPLGKGNIVQLGAASLQYGGVGTNTVNHRLSLEADRGRVNVSNTTGTLVWAGNVEGGLTTVLRKEGAGTLRLSGANGFGGTTRIDAGKLQVIGGNALPNTGAVEIAAGAMLELLPGTNETIGGLKGEGTVNLGGQRLTLGGTNESTSYGGLIIGSGLSRIEKRGSGTLALTNVENSFAGGLFVPDGAVSVPFLRNTGTNSPLGSAGPIGLGDAVTNGRLIVTSADPGATNRPIVLGDAGGTIEVAHEAADLAMTGPVSGSGALLKLGLGRLRFGSSFAGPIVVANGIFTPTIDIPGRVTVINPAIVTSADGSIHTFGELFLAGGMLAPGGEGAPGILAVDELVVDAGTLSIDLGSAAAGGYDQLMLTDGLEIGSPIELSLNLQYDPVDRVDVFRIVTSDILTVLNGPEGRFRYGTNLLEEGEEFLVTDGEFTQYFGIRYNPNGEGGAELFAAPEPGTSLLLLGGSLCVAARRRRRLGRSAQES